MTVINGHGELPAVTYGFIGMSHSFAFRRVHLVRVAKVLIGLGNMGYRMAKNLRSELSADSALVVCEVVQSVLDKFVGETKGLIRVANTPKEVSEQSVSCDNAPIEIGSLTDMKDIILTMLPAGKHVKQVFTDQSNGLLSISKSSKPKLFIECSTIDVPTSLEVAEAVSQSALGSFADVPVSGGPTGAEAATLTFMAGGSTDVIGRVKPIVMTMGKTFFHCGGAGAGLATKQINNYISGICMLGTAEAMNLGIRYGLDPKVLAGVINSSTGRSYNSIEQNPVKGISPNSSAERDFENGFSIELCKGVLHMAINLGERVGARLPLSQGLIDTYEAASMDDRCKGKDCRSVYRYVADN